MPVTEARKKAVETTGTAKTAETAETTETAETAGTAKTAKIAETIQINKNCEKSKSGKYLGNLI